MNFEEFISFVKTRFFYLFNCIKEFNNNSLEEVFVPIADDKADEIFLSELDKEASAIIEADDVVLDDVVSEEEEEEEYGFEQELEDIDNYSDDEYDNYYHT